MSKSFGDFILILEEKKGRGGPDYNYEVALETQVKRKPLNTNNNQLSQK